MERTCDRRVSPSFCAVPRRWADDLPSPSLPRFVAVCTCHHSRLYGPIGLAPFLLLLFACFVAFTCHDSRLFRAGAFPSPALPLLCGFYLPPFALILPTGLAPFLVLPPFALMWPLLLLCGFCLPPFAPIWPTGLAPFLLLLFVRPLLLFLPSLRLTWPTGLAPVLLLAFYEPVVGLPAIIQAYLADWAGACPFASFRAYCSSIWFGACTFSFFGFATLAVSQLFFLLLSSSPSPLHFHGIRRWLSNERGSTKIGPTAREGALRSKCAAVPRKSRKKARTRPTTPATA